MRIILKDDTELYKFGVSSGPNSKNRMMQIALSIYEIYRELPRITVIRDRKVDGEEVFKLENTLHKFFSFYKYTGSHFDGNTECFTDLTKEVSIQAFEATLRGDEPQHSYLRDKDKIPF